MSGAVLAPCLRVQQPHPVGRIQPTAAEAPRGASSTPKVLLFALIGSEPWDAPPTTNPLVTNVQAVAVKSMGLKRVLEV